MNNVPFFPLPGRTGIPGSPDANRVHLAKPKRFDYASNVPTVLREHGFNVRIYTRDHEPPPVHCWKDDGELVIELDPLAIRENHGLSKGDVRRALAIVGAHQPFLLAAWRRIHS